MRQNTGCESFQACRRYTIRRPVFTIWQGIRIRVYTLSCDGDLICWDTNHRGQRIWSVNLYDTYSIHRRPKVGRSGQRDYGYTTAPLVHGDWVIV